MSIQKISREEILTEGVRSLPNRPSAPSMYSGRTLSATELKAAFDRLPTLVAERFNALLEGTGLFDSQNPKDSLAELIATGLSPYHSLSDFFADVANGNLATYLCADGKASLAAVLTQMKEDILSLAKRSVAVEGDGDILTDAEISDSSVTLRRGLRKEDILNEAKTYADTPTGRVTANCPFPVSGGEVAKVLDELYLPDSIEKRVSVLEAAAEGILYTYPTEDTEGAYIRADSRVLPHGALCRLGGLLLPPQNLLPERILTTYHGDTLSITWDEEERCLVFNGTVSPQSSPVILAPFTADAGYSYYSGGIFTRGGSVQKSGTGNTFLRFCAEDGKNVNFDISQTNYSSSSTLLRTSSDRFSYIAIVANAELRFTDYKCNILLQLGENEEPSYVPCESTVRCSPVPAALIAKSANEWRGEYESSGTGGVILSSPSPITAGDYLISFYSQSNTMDASCYLFTYLENGRIIKRAVKKNQRASVSLSIDAPVIKFVILPAESEEASAPYTMRVKDFQVERCPEDENMEYAVGFTPYSMQTLKLPATFARYNDLFYGMGGELCNHFNFEEGTFVTRVNIFRIGEGLTFTADPEVEGRFHATVSLPAPLAAGTEYHPYVILRAPRDDDDHDECIRFTESGFTLQSQMFKTPEEVAAFFSLFPVDVLYAVPEEIEFLEEGEADFRSPPVIPLVSEGLITLSDAEGTPVPCFVRMQYQCHNRLEEVTE